VASFVSGIRADDRARELPVCGIGKVIAAVAGVRGHGGSSNGEMSLEG